MSDGKFRWYQDEKKLAAFQIAILTYKYNLPHMSFTRPKDRSKMLAFPIKIFAEQN